MNTATYPAVAPVAGPDPWAEVNDPITAMPAGAVAMAASVLFILWQASSIGLPGGDFLALVMTRVADVPSASAPLPAVGPEALPPAAAARMYLSLPLDEDDSSSSSSCPAGWDELGDFRLTAYVLAQEEDFASSAPVEGVCGLEGTWPSAFLFGQGVRMQGSGRAADGRIVHYRGGGCFEVLDCARTASGRCARSNHTVAVDRSVVPLGADVWIEGLGIRRADDVGGGIRGHHIDVYHGADVGMKEAQTLTRRGRVCVRPDTLEG